MNFTEGAEIGGRFRLVAPIGRGAFAVVWQALDRELQRDVALKIVTLQEQNDDQRQRALREAKTLADMKHDSLVVCRHCYEDPAGRFIALALDLANGKTLAECEKDLSRSHKISVLYHVTTALAYLHSRDVAHRDIKPENIVVADQFVNDPANPVFVKLLDLGIGIRAGKGKRLTLTGRVLGTPEYLAPEILAKQRFMPVEDPIDELKRDVYALGVLAYRLLESNTRHPSGLEWGLPMEEYAGAYIDQDNSGESASTVDGPFGEFFRLSLAYRPRRRAAHAGKLIDFFEKPKTRIPAPARPPEAPIQPPPPPLYAPQQAPLPHASQQAHYSNQTRSTVGSVAPQKPPPKWLLVGFGIAVASGLTALGVWLVVPSSNKTTPTATPTSSSRPQPTVGPSSLPTSTTIPVSAPLKVTNVTSRAVINLTGTKDLDAKHSLPMAFDDDPTTGWCEGVPGNGKGSTIAFDLSPGVTVTSLEVTGGWAYYSPEAAVTAPPGDMWELSYVASRIDVDIDGRVQTVHFSRERDRGRAETLLVPKGARRVVLTVVEVNGTPRSALNTCLDGIRLWGY